MHVAPDFLKDLQQLLAENWPAVCNPQLPDAVAMERGK